MGNGNVSVAILTGGESRRMGQDKALLDWNGTPMLAHILARLRPLGELIAEVLIVGDRPQYHEFGAAVIADRYPGAGTLGGIATALEVARNDWVLILACDMPLISATLIREMLKLPRDCDALVPVVEGSHGGQRGRQTFHTTHALYRSTCLPSIQRRIDIDDLRVISFFDDIVVREVDESWSREFDPDLRSFLNINRPDELEFARQIAGIAKSC